MFKKDIQPEKRVIYEDPICMISKTSVLSFPKSSTTLFILRSDFYPASLSQANIQLDLLCKKGEARIESVFSLEKHANLLHCSYTTSQVTMTFLEGFQDVFDFMDIAIVVKLAPSTKKFKMKMTLTTHSSIDTSTITGHRMRVFTMLFDREKRLDPLPDDEEIVQRALHKSSTISNTIFYNSRDSFQVKQPIHPESRHICDLNMLEVDAYMYTLRKVAVIYAKPAVSQGLYRCGIIVLNGKFNTIFPRKLHRQAKIEFELALANEMHDPVIVTQFILDESPSLTECKSDTKKSKVSLVVREGRDGLPKNLNVAIIVKIPLVTSEFKAKINIQPYGRECSKLSAFKTGKENLLFDCSKQLIPLHEDSKVIKHAMRVVDTLSPFLKI